MTAGHDYMPPVRGVGAPSGRSTRRQQADLLRDAIRDARIQLDSARAEARLFRDRSYQAACAADRAEQAWRDKWPGLAGLIDHADGA